MNIRRFLIFIFLVTAIVGIIVIIFSIESYRHKNVESVQTINGVKLERSFQGDEPIPVNESPDEFQKRLYREGEANLEEVIKGMSTFEAAKYLRSGMTPSHNDIFFEKINQAIKENPTFEALMLRGAASWSLRDDKKSAKKDFARAAEINPESYEAHQELARVLCALDKYEDSIVEAKKAIELGSKDGYLILGWSYLRKEDLREALKYFDEFIKYYPNSSAVGTAEYIRAKINESGKH